MTLQELLSPEVINRVMSKRKPSSGFRKWWEEMNNINLKRNTMPHISMGTISKIDAGIFGNKKVNSAFGELEIKDCEDAPYCNIVLTLSTNGLKYLADICNRYIKQLDNEIINCKETLINEAKVSFGKMADCIIIDDPVYPSWSVEKVSFFTYRWFSMCKRYYSM